MRSRLSKTIAMMMLIIMVMTSIGCSIKETGNETSQSAEATQKTAETNGKENATEEILSCVFVMPGSARRDTEYMQEVISKKMQADGVNVELILKYIPWDAWDQKVNLMFSTGEEFDLFHTRDNRFPNTSSLAGRGAIVPLDTLLDQYGPVIKKEVPDFAWKQATIQGKIYAIPAVWIELSNTMGWISVRKDLLDKNGLKIPATPDELIEVAEALQKSIPEKTYCTVHSLQSIMAFLHRTFESYPFFVKQGEELVMIGQDGSVKSWIESDEFKKQCEFFRKLYTKGLISPDILGMTSDQIINLKSNGKFLFHFDRLFADIPTIKANVPEAEIEVFRLNPEVSTLREQGYANCNTIPSSSKHPEAAVKFLNWLYSSQENMDLLIYGEKGKHWNNAGEKRVEIINLKDPDYNFDWWMIGLLKYQRFDINASELQIKYEGTMDDEAVNFIGMGFNFNSEPVKVEYANCIAEFQNSIYPLKLGVMDYEKEFSNALKRMKAAGLDEVVAEYQKQFADFIASKQ